MRQGFGSQFGGLRQALAGAGAVFLLTMLFVWPLAAQRSVVIPGHWRSGAHIPKPDLTGIEQIRFLTEAEYPPFNYYDDDTQLTGFNVDIARAMCDVLVVRCDFQVLDWDDLVPALNNGDGDAIIASMVITEKTLKQVDFTDRYYQTPARFIARVTNKQRKISPRTIDGRKVGVVQNSAHAAYLKDFFPRVKIVSFDDLGDAKEALKGGFVDYLFADGITMLFWLNGQDSARCCEFRGGPYTESRYFGEGVAVAVKKGDRRMRTILNYALAEVRKSGRYDEYFLRYFPQSFY